MRDILDQSLKFQGQGFLGLLEVTSIHATIFFVKYRATVEGH